MFTVPYGTNYALFYSYNFTADMDPTSYTWTIDILKADESGYDTYAVDTAETTVKTDDALLLFDLIADSENPKSLYDSFDVIYPVYLLKTGSNLYFHLLREVQKPAACQIAPNRFIVTWWSAFYDTYDITTNGYDDANDKMIRTSNTTRPTTYNKVMLSSFMTFMRCTQRWNDGTAHEVKNVLIPVFTKPSLLWYTNVTNQNVASLQVVKAQGAGFGGSVNVKNIIMKTDPTLSPNYEYTGASYVVSYFKD
jgi:hypothetical protein